MVTLNFQVPLGEDGLRVMAHKIEGERDKIDPKRAPKQFTAFSMLLEAIESERSKLLKKARR